MYQRVGLLLLRRRVQPAREVSKDRPEHWLTGAHFAVPYRNRFTAPHAGLRIFLTNPHAHQLLDFSSHL